MKLAKGKLRGLWMIVAAAIVCGVCATATGVGAQDPHAPRGMPAFYAVPSGISAKQPGELLKWQKLSVAGVDGTTYRVMYVSTDEQGKPAAVTGLVYVPHRRAPRGGYPVVTWAHGTNGMADQCAPSLDPSSALPTNSVLNQLLGQGWEVTASDYQGEGTPPGLLPYLVGDLAARNTIDIVRAARHLSAAHAGSTYLVWGHSEGGQTAMFAWELGPTYGSRSGLHLVGVVAGAPPSQFAYIYQALISSPYRFYLFMGAAGFNEAYGNRRAPLGEVLTQTAIRLLPELRKGCFDYLMATIDKYSLPQFAKANPFDLPAWKALLEANDPEYFSKPNDIPLLIIQGGADEQIPVVSTQLLAQHLCGIGQDLERWIYPGLSHTGVIPVSADDMVHWMSDRFAGDPNPDPYVPTGEPGLQTTTCPG